MPTEWQVKRMNAEIFRSRTVYLTSTPITADRFHCQKTTSPGFHMNGNNCESITVDEDTLFRARCFRFRNTQRSVQAFG